MGSEIIREAGIKGKLLSIPSEQLWAPLWKRWIEQQAFDQRV